MVKLAASLLYHPKPPFHSHTFFVCTRIRWCVCWLPRRGTRRGASSRDWKRTAPLAELSAGRPSSPGSSSSTRNRAVWGEQANSRALVHCFCDTVRFLGYIFSLVIQRLQTWYPLHPCLPLSILGLNFREESNAKDKFYILEDVTISGMVTFHNVLSKMVRVIVVWLVSGVTHWFWPS